MTTHDKDKIIAAANECHHLYSEWNIDIERFYAIAFENGRQAEREFAETNMSDATKADEKAWEEGVLMAASVLMAAHNEPTLAATILIELGLRGADCSCLDEFDKENLRRISEQSGSRLKLIGL